MTVSWSPKITFNLLKIFWILTRCSSIFWMTTRKNSLKSRFIEITIDQRGINRNSCSWSNVMTTWLATWIALIKLWPLLLNLYYLKFLFENARQKVFSQYFWSGVFPLPSMNYSSYKVSIGWVDVIRTFYKLRSLRNIQELIRFHCT